MSTILNGLTTIGVLAAHEADQAYMDMPRIRRLRQQLDDRILCSIWLGMDDAAPWIQRRNYDAPNDYRGAYFANLNL